MGKFESRLTELQGCLKNSRNIIGLLCDIRNCVCVYETLTDLAGLIRTGKKLERIKTEQFSETQDVTL